MPKTNIIVYVWPNFFLTNKSEWRPTFPRITYLSKKFRTRHWQRSWRDSTAQHYSLRMFRSCTALLSSKTLTQSAPRRTRQFILSTRHFSEVSKDAPTSEETAQVHDGGKVETGGDIEPDSELASKLKAKEAEVVDLTVCSLAINR